MALKTCRGSGSIRFVAPWMRSTLPALLCAVNLLVCDDEQRIQRFHHRRMGDALVLAGLCRKLLLHLLRRTNGVCWYTRCREDGRCSVRRGCTSGLMLRYLTLERFGLFDSCPQRCVELAITAVALFGSGRGLVGQNFGLRWGRGAWTWSSIGMPVRMGNSDTVNPTTKITPGYWNNYPGAFLLRMFPELRNSEVLTELHCADAVLSGSGCLRACVNPLVNWFPKDLDIFVTTHASRTRVVNAIRKVVCADKSSRLMYEQIGRICNIRVIPIGEHARMESMDGREGMDAERWYQIIQLRGEQPLQHYEVVDGTLQRLPPPRLWKHLGVRNGKELYRNFGITAGFDLAVCQVSVSVGKTWEVDETGAVSVLEFRVSNGCVHAVEQNQIAFYLAEVNEERRRKYELRGYPMIGVQGICH